MSDTLIKVENVSKKFCRSLKKSLWYGMQDLGREVTGRRHGGDGELRPGEFWAVKDVSFELKRGECLGLIGHNGAGKTTLLRMLNGLIKPDAGRIEMNGRVGSLISLGAGFNPILTGRENIYVNASVLGLSKREIDEKLDEIIDFAEIGDFIGAPVQSYSSGMQVRLGFAVATALKPDVLLLDEVLAVGDAGFRGKCYRRISECIETSAVIFVSHNTEQVARICNYGCLLERGEMKYVGEAGRAIEAYVKSVEDKSVNIENSFSKVYSPLNNVVIETDNYEIKQGKKINLYFSVQSEEIIKNAWFRVVFFNSKGGYAADVDLKTAHLNIPVGVSKISILLENIRLQGGSYKMGVNIFGAKGEILYWTYKEITLSVFGQNHVGNADYQLEGSAEVCSCL